MCISKGNAKKQPTTPKKAKVNERKLLCTTDFQANTRNHKTSQTKHENVNKR